MIPVEAFPFVVAIILALVATGHLLRTAPDFSNYCPGSVVRDLSADPPPASPPAQEGCRRAEGPEPAPLGGTPRQKELAPSSSKKHRDSPSGSAEARGL